MMENKVSPFKPALNNGIILGIVSIFISVIIWIAGLMESMGFAGSFYILMFNLTITVVLLVVFTKSYRDNLLDRKITFGKAFVFAFLVVIVSVILSAIYNYIFNTFIDPDYVQRLMLSMQDKTVAMLENSGAGDEAIDAMLAKFEEQGIPSVLKQVQQALIGGIVGGAFMALISSAIIKKDNTEA
ncbi:MAG: hypothetical protein DRI74_06025 [Bacteroidetes bacterium]|nr:MAG: hypothetical protein DRI74_06025 [Bacteroidota bacterium]